MNVILLKLPPQHSRLTLRKEGIRVTCLTLNNLTYTFFHQKFYQILFDIEINLINLFHHNCVISQQNRLYIKRKKIFFISNCNKACFIAIITSSFLNNWKWETLNEKHNMKWNHYSNALKLFNVYNTI